MNYHFVLSFTRTYDGKHVTCVGQVAVSQSLELRMQMG
jgi:hypothetical protein